MVTTRRALQEVVLVPDDLAELRFTVRVGQELRRDILIETLETRGFERVPMVEAAGCYAVRGGLVDLFSFGAANPARVEFWGDDVESIRFFDILDQRSTDTTDRVDILPVRFGDRTGSTRTTRSSILARLPRDTVLVRIGARPWEDEPRGAWKARATMSRPDATGNPARLPARSFSLPIAGRAKRAGIHRSSFEEEQSATPCFRPRPARNQA